MYIELSKEDLTKAVTKYLTNRIQGEINLTVYEDYDNQKEKPIFSFEIFVKDQNENT